MEQLRPFGNIIAGNFTSFSNKHFDIILNATSASLNNAMAEVPADIFAHATLAYDMMYGNELSRFLKFAQQLGARQVADGIVMLVEQAAESFFLWRGCNAADQTSYYPAEINEFKAIY